MRECGGVSEGWDGCVGEKRRSACINKNSPAVHSPLLCNVSCSIRLCNTTGRMGDTV